VFVKKAVSDVVLKLKGIFHLVKGCI